MRQPYVVSPKLFRHAPISKSGSLCELIIYNKGNQVEESIQVELDPELKSELLASSSSDITLQGSTLNIERLHKGCEASVMLLIEYGLLDSTKIITLSSKSTKGTILKKITDVPPNFAKAFLATVLFLGFFPAMDYGPKVYDKLHGEYIQRQLQPTYLHGWNNLSKYYESDFRQSYSNQEFPIRFLQRQVDNVKRSVLVFEAYNKTALPMEVTANKVDSALGDLAHFVNLNVQPMSKQVFTILEPEVISSSLTPELEFSLKWGEDFIYGLRYLVHPK
jgi:hypothetical protein